MATLPRSQRLAVELRHVEGLSYPEIAEALAKPIGTVKSDVHRGVERLRRAYETDEAREVAPGPQRLTKDSPAGRPAGRPDISRIERKVMAR